MKSDAENVTSIFSFLLKVFLADNDFIRKFMHVITQFVFLQSFLRPNKTPLEKWEEKKKKREYTVIIK